MSLKTAEGLHEAYEKGIVYSDMNSANLMVTSKGQAKTVDFRLAYDDEAKCER